MIQIQIKKRAEFIKKANFVLIYTQVAINLMAKRDWEHCKELIEYSLNNLSDMYEMIGGFEKEEEKEA